MRTVLTTCILMIRMTKQIPTTLNKLLLHHQVHYKFCTCLFVEGLRIVILHGYVSNQLLLLLIPINCAVLRVGVHTQQDNKF